MDGKKENKCFSFPVKTQEFFILKEAVMLFAIGQGSVYKKEMTEARVGSRKLKRGNGFISPQKIRTDGS